MLNSYEENYLNLLNKVRNTGEPIEGRNGQTISRFGDKLKIDALKDNTFPVLTTRKMHTPGIFGELAAFVRGETSLMRFKYWGCNYWDENAENWPPNKDKPFQEYEVGKIYGAQWRNFNGVDQLKDLIHNLKHHPYSRRHVLTAYNPAELDQGCLPPCHLLVQYAVRGGTYLESCVYMRSVDLCVGLPTDVALYAAMQVVLAAELGLYPGRITFMLGDAHIYVNHLEQVAEQLIRVPRALPNYDLLQGTKLLEFVPDALILFNYNPQSRINYAFNV